MLGARAPGGRRGTRRPGRGGRSAQRAAGWPARCAAAAPAPTTPRIAGDGNRTAAARPAAPAHRQSPGRGGPPPASHARQRPASGTGTPHRGGIKITVARQHTRGIPDLGHLRLDAAPVTLGTNTVRSPGPAGSPASASGVKLPRTADWSPTTTGPGPRTQPHLQPSPAPPGSPIPRTVADAPACPAIDLAQTPTDQRADHPKSARPPATPTLAAQPPRSDLASRVTRRVVTVGNEALIWRSPNPAPRRHRRDLPS
jgi:hypothetical protein